MSVLTQSNPTFNRFEIVSSGVTSLTKPANDSGETVQVAHGLSSVPIALAFIEDSGLYYPLPHLTMIDDGTATLKVGVKVSVVTDSTYLYVTATTAETGASYSTAKTYNIRYYLLLETAS